MFVLSLQFCQSQHNMAEDSTRR